MNSLIFWLGWMAFLWIGYLLGYRKCATDVDNATKASEPLKGIIAIKKGTKITCENGHAICTVMEDIFVGDDEWTGKLGEFRLKEPCGGEPYKEIKCDCGASWISDNEYGTTLHTDIGWM